MAQAIGVEFGQRMTVVGPDGTTAVFNDTTDPNFAGAITEQTGLDSADVRENADDLVQMDGGVHGDFFEGRRPISLNGKVYGHSTALQRNQRIDLIKRATNALRPGAHPGGVYTNLVVNPSAEVNATDGGWAVYGGAGSALARIVGIANDGTSSFALTGPTTPGNSVLHNGNTKMPVTGGQSYFGAAVYSTPSGVRTATTSIQWFDSGGNFISSVSGTTAATTTTGWTRASVLATAPANATSALIQAAHTTTAANEVSYVDSIIFAQSSAALSYFDGDFNGADYKGAWTGTAHNSTSLLRGAGSDLGNARILWTPSGGVPVYTEVRKQQPFRVTGAWIKDFQVQMVAADPRIYSQSLHTSTGLSAGAPGTAGVSFGVPFGITFSVATPASTLTVLNDGSATSSPVYYINGPCVNPAIYNATTGKTITFAYTLAANEGLVVDVQNRRVYLGTRTSATNLMPAPSNENAIKALASGVNWTTTITASGTSGVTSFSGSNHLAHAWNGTATDTNMGTTAGFAAFPSAGTYTVSMYVYVPGTYTGSAFSIGTDASFAGSTQTATVGVDLSKRNQWQRIYSTINVAAADLAGFFILRHGAYPAAAGTSTVYTDAVQIEAGPTPTRYGDGSYSGWTWSGTVGNSTSSGPSGEVVATANSRYGAVDFGNTSWAGIAPGNNDLRFIPFSWSAGAGFRVDWRDAWL